MNTFDSLKKSMEKGSSSRIRGRAHIMFRGFSADTVMQIKIQKNIQFSKHH